MLGLLPSLILPQFTAEGVVLAKESASSDTASAFIEQVAINDSANNNLELISESGFYGDGFVEQSASLPSQPEAAEKSLALKSVIITVYSSTPDQTDSSPFTTASGTQVRDGVVAANFLSFGTKIKLPQIYGEKVFVVEDRMAKRNSHKLDIWFSDRESALQFGVRRADVLVLF